MKINLLARFAESIFWLARYMERVENLARLLEVTETFTYDARGNQDWEAILEINADMTRFRAGHKEVTLRSVAHFYILDGANPTSIVASLDMARENARSLRHLISTEMWNQINVFHGRVKALDRRDVSPAKVSTVCRMIKEGCQAHTGITEGTLYQDEAWNFYWIGRAIERADQTSRLVDIGYLRAIRTSRDLSSRAQDTHWGALLRSATGYHAFRRVHRIRTDAVEVIRFLTQDEALPRSLLTCVGGARALTRGLETRHGMNTGRAALATLDGIDKHLRGTDVAALLDAGPHAFIDDLQCRLAEYTQVLGRDCFAQDA
ncbi:MAG: alpha-E domain-containing protein [Nitrospirae bacterium]|nr:alpha-E domain-containing protein [Nitrospirota bacterium]